MKSNHFAFNGFWIFNSLIITFCLILSACQPNPNEPETLSDQVDVDLLEEASNEADSDEWPSDLARPPEPNPLNLDITVEPDNAVSDVIWPDQGGVLNVLDAAGNNFTLEIPAGALIAPIEISMTAIDSVEGLENAEGFFGVVLEPDGLIFAESAQLIIEVNEHEDLTDSFAFATQEDGNDFHLDGFELNGNTITIPVNHFSARAMAAVGKAAIAESIRAKHNNPSWGEASFNNDWYGALNEGIEGDELTEIFDDAYRTWFWTSVQNAITQATISPLVMGHLEQAVGESVRWLKYIDEDNASTYSRELGKIVTLSVAFRNAFASSDLLCQTTKDPNEAIRMLRWMAMIDNFPKLNLWDGGGSVLGIVSVDGIKRSDAIQMIEDCFRFDFDFRSLVVADWEKFKVAMQVALRKPIDIEFNATDFKIEEVEISLPYERLSIDPPFPGGCDFSTQNGVVTFKVHVSVNFSYQVQEISEVWVEFEFDEKPAEMLTCAGRTMTLWHAAFSDAHRLVERQQAIGAKLNIVNSLSKYAIFEYEGRSRTQADVLTEMSLIHTPE